MPKVLIPAEVEDLWQMRMVKIAFSLPEKAIFYFQKRRSQSP